MARRDPESRDFYKGLAATVLVVAAFVAYAYWFKPGADQPEPKRERSTKNAPAVIATVYECNSSGVRTLSDKPCGEDARTREVLEPNRMPADGKEKPKSAK